MTTSLLDEVAAATDVDPDDGRPGRFLLVLATNLDSGLPRIFDLGAIARDKPAPDRIDRYIDALMASAAIPVAFPPVFIDGDMHVDGGARLALFFNRLMEDQRVIDRCAHRSGSKTGHYCQFRGDGGAKLHREHARRYWSGEASTWCSIRLRWTAFIEPSARPSETAPRSVTQPPRAPTVSRPLIPKNVFERSFLQCLFAEGKTLGSSGDALASRGWINSPEA